MALRPALAPPSDLWDQPDHARVPHIKARMKRGDAEIAPQRAEKRRVCSGVGPGGAIGTVLRPFFSIAHGAMPPVSLALMVTRGTILSGRIGGPVMAE